MRSTRSLFLASTLLAVAACDGEASSLDGVVDAGADVIASDGATTATDTSSTSDTATSDTGSADTGTAHDVATVPDTSGSDVTLIHLDGATITVEGEGVTVAGTVATITQPGMFRVDGTSSDARVVVDSDADGTVYLSLAGVDITSTTNAPIAIMSADDAVLVLEDGTTNRVTDAQSYVFEADEDEPNAAVFSKDDLTLTGNGSLTVTARYNDGVASKDGLIIAAGTLSIDAVDDGIRGKDYVILAGGDISIDAGGDGVKSDNAEDASLGYVSIEGGSLVITAAADGVDAETEVAISAGVVDVTTGGGAGGYVASDASVKGLKGTASVAISGGDITIDSADDAIHSNASVFVSGGTMVIATGDDGIHSDADLTINGGTIDITECYEGVEGLDVVISDGVVRVTASDDGLNGAGGVDGSGGGTWGPPGGGPSGGGGTATFIMSGGYVAVNAMGDGIDINGSVTMTGGTLAVSGPTSSNNGALDYDGTFVISGGLVVAAGSSGMAQAPSAQGSSQSSVLIGFTTTQSAGTLVRVQTTAGEEVVTYAPAKPYQSVALSSAALVNGQSYQIYLGGSSTGSVADGLYSGGQYTPGSLYQTFTVSSTVTTVGSVGGGPGGGGGF